MTTLRMQPVHIIGGGLAGCEAAWQIASRAHPGRAARDAAHRARPPRTRPQALAELVCSNSFRSDDRETNAVGLLHEEMRRLGSLIMRCGDANQVPAGGALAVDREGFAAAVTAAIEAQPADRRSAARKSASPPADWDSVIVATGPLTSPALADFVRALTGRRLARLLRRDRADRASRLHRHVGRLVPVALRQGRPRRLGRRLHQLPDDARAVSGLRRGAGRRRQDHVPRVGSRHALFRRLPADRGDGGARARRRCATAR